MSGPKYEAKFSWPSAAPHSVIVTGTFDSWSGSTHHLSKVGDAFEGSIELDWGKTYEYKYVVDGTWQARDDHDKEWDEHGNMNNVVRAPPAPAHVEEPVPEAKDEPAVELPAATVIAPTKEEQEPVAADEATPAAAAVEEEFAAARQDDVSKAIDDATTASTATPSVNDTVPPHTVDSDLSSTQSVRAADGLAMSAPAAAEAPTGEPTDAQKIAATTTTEATTPKPLAKALEPLTTAPDAPAAVTPETVQQQVSELSVEAQQLAAQGLEQASALASHGAAQASAGVASLVAGVEGLVFANKGGESFAEGQTKALERVDGANLSENGTSATDFSLVDDASQADDYHHVPTPPRLEAEEPIVVHTPTADSGAAPAVPLAEVAPALDLASLQPSSTTTTTTAEPTLASTLSSTGASQPTVTNHAKVEEDEAPALEAAKQDLAARSSSAPTPTPAPAPAAAVPSESMTSSQTSSAPTTSTAAPAVPAKDSPPASTTTTVPPGGYPSALSSKSAVGKTKGEDDKIRKRKSSLFGKVSRIFSGGKDKEAK